MVKRLFHKLSCYTLPTMFLMGILSWTLYVPIRAVHATISESVRVPSFIDIHETERAAYLSTTAPLTRTFNGMTALVQILFAITEF